MTDEPECSATDIEPTGNTGLLTTTAQFSARRGDTLADAKRNGWTDSADHVPNAGQMVNSASKMRADLARPIPPPVHYVPGPVRIKTFPDSVVRHNLIDLDNHRLSWNRILHKRWNEAHTGWVLQWLPILSQAQYVDFMDTCAMKGTQDWPVKWLHTVMLRIMNGKEFRHAGSDRNSGRSTDRNSGRGRG